MDTSSLDAARFIFYHGLISQPRSIIPFQLDPYTEKALSILETDNDLDYTLALVQKEVSRVREGSCCEEIANLEWQIALARLMNQTLTFINDRSARAHQKLETYENQVQQLQAQLDNERNEKKDIKQQMDLRSEWERANRMRGRSFELKLQRVKAAVARKRKEAEELKQQVEELRRDLCQSSSQQIITCSLCYEPEHAVALSCGHIFGEECIRIWNAEHPERGKRCPQCRQESDRTIRLFSGT